MGQQRDKGTKTGSTFNSRPQGDKTATTNRNETPSNPKTFTDSTQNSRGTAGTQRLDE